MSHDSRLTFKVSRLKSHDSRFTFHISRFTSYTSRFLAIILFFTIIGCENDMQQVKNLGKKKVQVEEGRDINTLYSMGGKLKSNLKAPLMLRYMVDSPYVEFPKGIHVDMYKDSVTIESVVIAKYCKYLESQDKVYMRDSVRVNNITGDTLWSNELWWDKQKQIYYSNKPVRIFQKMANQRIVGTGFVATQSLDKWVINTPVGTMDFPKEMQ